MARLTFEENGAWAARDTAAALARLAAFEDLAEELAAEQRLLAARLADLRARDKTRSARFRDLLARKLTGGQMLALLAARGLADLPEENP